jgi:hypothetical protein
LGSVLGYKPLTSSVQYEIILVGTEIKGVTNMSNLFDNFNLFEEMVEWKVEELGRELTDTELDEIFDTMESHNGFSSNTG